MKASSWEYRCSLIFHCQVRLWQWMAMAYLLPIANHSVTDLGCHWTNLPRWCLTSTTVWHLGRLDGLVFPGNGSVFASGFWSSAVKSEISAFFYCSSCYWSRVPILPSSAEAQEEQGCNQGFDALCKSFTFLFGGLEEARDSCDVVIQHLWKLIENSGWSHMLYQGAILTYPPLSDNKPEVFQASGTPPGKAFVWATANPVLATDIRCSPVWLVGTNWTSEVNNH